MTRSFRSPGLPAPATPPKMPKPPPVNRRPNAWPKVPPYLEREIGK